MTEMCALPLHADAGQSLGPVQFPQPEDQKSAYLPYLASHVAPRPPGGKLLTLMEGAAAADYNLSSIDIRQAYLWQRRRLQEGRTRRR